MNKNGYISKKEIAELKKLIRESNYPEEFKKIGAVGMMKRYD